MVSSLSKRLLQIGEVSSDLKGKVTFRRGRLEVRSVMTSRPDIL
jgi:hypothetical protein